MIVQLTGLALEPFCLGWLGLVVKHMACSLDYLLRNDHRHPQVLFGDPNRLKWRLIEAKLSAGIAPEDAHRYSTKAESSGVLSFSLAESRALRADLKKLYALLRDFRGHYIPGVTPGDTDCVFVLHDEFPKGPDGKPNLTKEPRLAVHFHYAREHLPTGKRLTPYFWKRDRKRIACLQDFLSAKYGLTSANWLKAPSSIPQRDTRRGTAEDIENRLMDKMAAGQIRSRADVIKALVDDGHKVTVRSDRNLSVELKSGAKVRLKGLLYEAGGVEKMLRAGITAPGQITETPVAERPTLEELEKRLAALEAPAANENQRRYGPKPDRAIAAPYGFAPAPRLRIPVPHLPTYRTAYTWGKTPKKDRDVDEIADQLEIHTKKLFGTLLGVFHSKEEKKIFEYFAQLREEEWQAMDRLAELIDEQNRRRSDGGMPL